MNLLQDNRFYNYNKDVKNTKQDKSKGGLGLDIDVTEYLEKAKETAWEKHKGAPYVTTPESAIYHTNPETVFLYNLHKLDKNLAQKWFRGEVATPVTADTDTRLKIELARRQTEKDLKMADDLRKNVKTSKQKNLGGKQKTQTQKTQTQKTDGVKQESTKTKIVPLTYPKQHDKDLVADKFVSVGLPTVVKDTWRNTAKGNMGQAITAALADYAMRTLTKDAYINKKIKNQMVAEGVKDEDRIKRAQQLARQSSSLLTGEFLRPVSEGERAQAQAQAAMQNAQYKKIVAQALKDEATALLKEGQAIAERVKIERDPIERKRLLADANYKNASARLMLARAKAVEEGRDSGSVDFNQMINSIFEQVSSTKK